MKQDCRQLKACGAEIEGSKNSNCPVYKAGKTCWEYDWVTFWSEYDAAGKKEGQKAMIADCEACVVRKHHRSEVDSFIEIVRNT